MQSQRIKLACLSTVRRRRKKELSTEGNSSNTDKAKEREESKEERPEEESKNVDDIRNVFNDTSKFSQSFEHGKTNQSEKKRQAVSKNVNEMSIAKDALNFTNVKIYPSTESTKEHERQQGKENCLTDDGHHMLDDELELKKKINFEDNEEPEVRYKQYQESKIKDERHCLKKRTHKEKEQLTGKLEINIDTHTSELTSNGDNSETTYSKRKGKNKRRKYEETNDLKQKEKPVEESERVVDVINIFRFESKSEKTSVQERKKIKEMDQKGRSNSEKMKVLQDESIFSSVDENKSIKEIDKLQLGQRKVKESIKEDENRSIKSDLTLINIDTYESIENCQTKKNNSEKEPEYGELEIKMNERRLKLTSKGDNTDRKIAIRTYKNPKEQIEDEDEQKQEEIPVQGSGNTADITYMFHNELKSIKHEKIEQHEKKTPIESANSDEIIGFQHESMLQNAKEQDTKENITENENVRIVSHSTDSNKEYVRDNELRRKNDTKDIKDPKFRGIEYKEGKNLKNYMPLIDPDKYEYENYPKKILQNGKKRLTDGVEINMDTNKSELTSNKENSETVEQNFKKITKNQRQSCDTKHESKHQENTGGKLENSDFKSKIPTESKLMEMVKQEKNEQLHHVKNANLDKFKNSAIPENIKEPGFKNTEQKGGINEFTSKYPDKEKHRKHTKKKTIIEELKINSDTPLIKVASKEGTPERRNSVRDNRNKNMKNVNTRLKELNILEEKLILSNKNEHEERRKENNDNDEGTKEDGINVFQSESIVTNIIKHYERTILENKGQYLEKKHNENSNTAELNMIQQIPEKLRSTNKNETEVKKKKKKKKKKRMKENINNDETLVFQDESSEERFSKQDKANKDYEFDDNNSVLTDKSVVLKTSTHKTGNNQRKG